MVYILININEFCKPGESMLSKRLQLARKAAGLSLRELAERVSLSHTAIDKYEKGEAKPSSDILLKLAKVLKVRIEYFFRPDLLSDQQLSFRKHNDIPQKHLDMITHQVIEKIERWLELEKLFPSASIPFLSIDLPEKISNLEEIEYAAESVRNVWKLGMGPISDLIDTFKMQGIRVFTFSINDLNNANEYPFDGIYTLHESIPIIAINENFPGDRQRFTLVHELAHLILDNRLSNEIDTEKACNRFAGAFLFPKDSVLKELGEFRSSIELKELDLLKHEFGVSMLCILHRAEELNVISKKYFDKMYKMFKTKGWYTQEPGNPYPKETTHFFEQFVFRALAEECLGESKAAELLDISLVEFRNIRAMRSKDASAHQ